MGEYVDLNGIKTWYDQAGTGDPLILLHGGIVTNETWGAQFPVLSERFAVYAPERRAHGHTPDVDGPLSLYDMADDTIAFIEQVVKQPAYLVGWSDGGTVALIVATKRPDLVRKCVSVGGNALPADQCGVPGLGLPTADDPSMGMFRAMYEAVSPDGPEHWATFIGKITQMWTSEPNLTADELAKITSPTLIVSGDDDMITLEHTISMYRDIPGSQLAIVPGASHALLMEKAEWANNLIIDYLVNDEQPTMMPFRRAPADATH